MVREYMNCN